MQPTPAFLKLASNTVNEWSGGETELQYRLIEMSYQAGADAELEGCCDLLSRSAVQGIDLLRAARRPKPPSLKQQALDELEARSCHSPSPGGTPRMTTQEAKEARAALELEIASRLTEFTKSTGCVIDRLDIAQFSSLCGVYRYGIDITARL